MDGKGEVDGKGEGDKNGDEDGKGGCFITFRESDTYSRGVENFTHVPRQKQANQLLSFNLPLGIGPPPKVIPLPSYQRFRSDPRKRA